MFKSINEFIKIFSFLFLISGIFFLTQQMYLLGGINIASFLIIKILDSDWAFDLFKFANHNMVVTTTTFMLIFVNVYFITQEMKYSPIFHKVSDQTKAEYVTFENDVFEAIKNCTDSHNYLLASIDEKLQITTGEIKETHTICYDSITTIQDVKIPEALSNESAKLCEKTKSDLKTLVATLGDYDYTKRNDKTIAEKIKTIVNTSTNNADKLRAMLQIKSIETPSKYLIECKF